ncbi:MAG: hypothetical protein H7Z43_09900, partial [Clostridia bacterium]|nr:hypothetical protein [Deltaproteobacteria bacterium]
MLDSLTHATDAAVERLTKLQSAAGAAGTERIDAFIAHARHEASAARATVHLATNDRAAAEREMLPAGLTQRGEFMRADEARNIGTDGRETGVVGVMFARSTQVDALSEVRLPRAVDRVMALAPAERKSAFDALIRLADTYASADDVGGLNMVRQVLTAASARAGDPSLAVQADLVDARYATHIGNFDAARTSLERASTAARKLRDDTGAGLRIQAVTGLVAVHCSEAAGADSGARAAADRLRALRTGLETDASNPLSRDQMARMAILEAQTYLSQQRANESLTSLKALARYSDLPWAASAVEEFRRNSDRGAAALLMVGFRAANSGSVVETAAYTLGGGGAGATAGFFAGGPPGAGVGLVLGTAAGSVTSNIVNVARSWNQVMEAFDTGMTSLGWGDTAVDAAFVGLNLVSAAAPYGGFARLNALGGAAALHESAPVVHALRRGAAAAGESLSREELEAHARELLVREFAEGTMGFGGRALTTAGLTAAVGPVAAEYARIQTTLTGTEREVALQALQRNLAGAGLVAAAMVGASVWTARVLGKVNRRWPVDARAADLPGMTPAIAAKPKRYPDTVPPLPRTLEEPHVAGRADTLSQTLDHAAKGIDPQRFEPAELTHLVDEMTSSVLDSLPDSPLSPADARSFVARRLVAYHEANGTDITRLRATLYDEISAATLLDRSRVPRSKSAVFDCVAGAIRRAREATTRGERGAVNISALRREFQREGHLSKEQAHALALAVRREAIERAIISRLAKEQERARSPLSGDSIQRTATQTAETAGIDATESATFTQSIIGQQGFDDWVHAQLPYERWTPKMRRAYFLMHSSAEVRGELGQLNSREFGSIFGNRVAPREAGVIGDIPGFAAFARRNPAEARILVNAGAFFDVRALITESGAPNFEAAVKSMNDRSNLRPHPTIKDYWIFERSAHELRELPRTLLIPMPELDHNGAFAMRGKAPERFSGSRWVGSELPKIETPPLDRIIVDGQLLKSLDGVLFFGGHGSPSGISRMVPEAVAQHLADEIMQKPHGTYGTVIIRACSQRDAQFGLWGRSSGQRIRESLNRELQARGYPQVNVLVSRRAGRTYDSFEGEFTRSYFPVGYDLATGRFRTKHLYTLTE